MVTQHLHARFSQVTPNLWLPKMAGVTGTQSTTHFFSILNFPTQVLHRAQLARSFILKFKWTSAPVCPLGFLSSSFRVWFWLQSEVTQGLMGWYKHGYDSKKWRFIVSPNTLNFHWNWWFSASHKSGFYVFTLHAIEYYPKCQFNLGAAMNDSLAQNLYFTQHWSHTSVY